MTNIPQKNSGLYTQTPAPQPFLDSKVNICNGKIFSEKVWTLAFLDPPTLRFLDSKKGPKEVSKKILDSAEPPPPFWINPDFFRGKYNEPFPKIYILQNNGKINTLIFQTAG